VNRTSLAMLVVLAGVAGCDDRGAPTGPPPPPPAAARVISCQADVRAGTFDCTTPTPPSGRLSADLVLGGQGTYVALRSSNVSYTSGTATFQADVTVENLTVLPLGTADGGTVTGVEVFFSSGPTVTSGTGTVTVANPDGTGTFTGTSQPYFLTTRSSRRRRCPLRERGSGPCRPRSTGSRSRCS